MDVSELSAEDYFDLLCQTQVNLDALINMIVGPGEDISRQDIATMLILIRNSIGSKAQHAVSAT